MLDNQASECIIFRSKEVFERIGRIWVVPPGDDIFSKLTREPSNQ
jgi:hypothetical protein